MSVERESVPPGLRWTWVGVVLAGLYALAVGTAGVYRLADATAVRWTALAAVVGAWEAGFLYWHLGANRPEGGQPVATLGTANAVTLARGALLAGVAGCWLLRPVGPVAWLPCVLYGTNVALDALDGRIARRTGRVTVLGQRLDMAFDTLGFLVAPVAAVLWGRLPVWYLSLSVARYAFRGGTALRRWRGRPVGELPDSRVRRPLAALQMCFITVALAPAVPRDLVWTGAVVVVPSLAVFARDYLAVTRFRRGGTA